MEGNDFIVNTVFVDTNLDTHMAIIVSDAITVSDLKDKIVLEHLQCFPIIGQIKINALKVKRKGYFYHLSDSMLLRSAFDGLKKDRFITIDVSKAEVDIPGPNPRADIDNESPSQNPDRKTDLQINSPESHLLKSPPAISHVGNSSKAEPIYVRNESEKPHPDRTDIAESAVAQNMVLEKAQKESPQLKNKGTVPPEKKEKRKYTKRKARSPATTDPDLEPVRSKAVQSKVRKVTSKMPNIHVDSFSAQTSVDRGIPPDSVDVSGKTAKIGIDPAADSSSAQINTETGLVDGDTHLTVHQTPVTEVVNSPAGLKKAGKKNNSVPAVPRRTPVKDKGKKMAARPGQVESISTDDAENGSLAGYLRNQTGLEKRRGDEEKETGVVNPNKNPDDQAKPTKTQTCDTKVGPSAMEEPEKMKAAGEPKANVDSSGVSGSSDSDSDCSEKTMGNVGQSKVEEYRFAARGMEEAKSDVIVARIPVGGAHDSPSFSVSGGSELAINQSDNPLGQGMGAPEKKEKKRYKKPIIDPLPLIAEERASGSDPEKDNVISKVSEGKKRRKVKPKKQDISDSGISPEPSVDKSPPSYNSIGHGKAKKMGTDPIDGSSTEKKHETHPGDGIVHLTVDLKPEEQVEISALSSRKSGKKKTRHEKTVSLDLADANEGHPPRCVIQKGGGCDEHLGSQYMLKKRGDDGDDKIKLENHFAREEYIPDAVGSAATELENGVSNSDGNLKYRDAEVPQSKEKRKYKKRKAEPLPLITEDKSCSPPYPERERGPSEAVDVKRRKAKQKKQGVPDDSMPPDAGDRKTEKMGTDDITGHSAEKKTDPGLDGKIGHLTIDGKPGAEFNKSSAVSKKGGRKKNLVSPDLKNTPIRDKGKKAVARPRREESVSTDESRRANKTHGVRVSGSAVEEPVKGGVDDTESSGSSGSDSDISEKTPIWRNGGQSKADDYRLAARNVERGKPGEAVVGLNGGAHSPSYDSPSASSETTSTDSRDPPQQGTQRKGERIVSRDSSPHTPRKGNVKLEAILRSSTRFKKTRATSDEMRDDDFPPDSQAVL